MKVNVGDKVYIPNQQRPYTVQARNERYIICTRPYNPKRTVMYFIIDLEDKIRGADNVLFCFGYETREDCIERLEELESGKIEISKRNYVELDVDIE